jgi:hypothetical protein
MSWRFDLGLLALLACESPRPSPPVLEGFLDNATDTQRKEFLDCAYVYRGLQIQELRECLVLKKHWPVALTQRVIADYYALTVKLADSIGRERER